MTLPPALPGVGSDVVGLEQGPARRFVSMEALYTSTAVVALAEIGDKTQLLAILLATRFRAPVPIILGILLATLANHFLAALVGVSAANLLDGEWFRYIIAASFIIMGLWTLIPDKLDDLDDKPTRFGAFLATLIAFFLVEMGDKTQLATIALGARFDQIIWVTAGTTLGMMLANVPAVFLGHELIERVPLNIVRFIAAALFVVIGVWLALQTAGWV
nr:TMEM165/GDT1 family protein [uncultured Hyphomonas sp.]